MKALPRTRPQVFYRVLLSFRVGMSLLLIGISLYLYNDWRTHRTLAAPNTPHTLTPMQQPLQFPDQAVSGIIEIGPDGEITQK